MASAFDLIQQAEQQKKPQPKKPERKPAPARPKPSARPKTNEELFFEQAKREGRVQPVKTYSKQELDNIANKKAALSWGPAPKTKTGPLAPSRVKKTVKKAAKQVGEMYAPSAKLHGSAMTIGPAGPGGIPPSVVAMKDDGGKMMEQGYRDFRESDPLAAAAFDAQVAGLFAFPLMPQVAQKAVGVGFGLHAAPRVYQRATGQLPGFEEDPLGTVFDVGMVAPLPFLGKSLVRDVAGMRRPPAPIPGIDPYGPVGNAAPLATDAPFLPNEPLPFIPPRPEPVRPMPPEVKAPVNMEAPAPLVKGTPMDTQVSTPAPKKPRAKKGKAASEPVAAKEPWEMTADEWANRFTEDEFAAIPNAAARRLAINPANHRSSVQRAIKEGKPVPPEVLADYPDLAPPSPKPPAPVKPQVEAPGAKETAKTGKRSRESDAIFDVIEAPAERPEKPSLEIGWHKTARRTEHRIVMPDGSYYQDPKTGRTWMTTGRKTADAQVGKVTRAWEKTAPKPAEPVKPAPEPPKSEPVAPPKANGNGNTPPKPPKKTAEAAPEPVPPSERPVFIKNAALDERRVEMGLNALEPTERKGWQEALDNAKRKGYDKTADEIVARGDGLTSDEAAGLMTRLTELDNAVLKATPEELPALLDKLDSYHQALKRAKGDVGRTLNEFKMGMNRGDYTLADALQMKRDNVGRALKPKEIEQVTAAVKELETLKAKLADAERLHAEEIVKRDAEIARLQAEGQTARGAEKKANATRAKDAAAKQRDARVMRARTERKKAIAEFNRLIGRANANLDPQALWVLGKIARSYVAEGAANLDAVVKMTMADISGVTREDVIRAITAKDPNRKPVGDTAKQGAYVRREARATQTLADLNEQIRTNTPKPPAKRGSAVLAGSELEKTQIAINRARRHVRVLLGEKNAPLALKAYDKINNTQRTMRATADMSATFRQGFILLARDISRGPKGVAALARKMARSVESAASEGRFDRVQNEMRNDPRFTDFERAGGHFTDAGSVTSAEELYVNGLAERIPVLGSVVRASERHMVAFLNQMRTDAFYKYLDANPNATAEEMAAMADVINVFSGRGNLGKGSAVGEWLGRAFFAPRFAVSRIQAPFMGAKYRKMPSVRNEANKSLAATAALGGSVLTLAYLAGADVEGNPNSPDWGKIRVGQTVYDIWAGLSQPARLALKLTLAKRGSNVQPLQEATRFMGYKMAPLPSTALELKTGRNIVGQKTTVPETLKGIVTPIGIGDVAEAYKAGGAKAAVPAGAATFLGIGASTYPKKSSSHSNGRPGSRR